MGCLYKFLPQVGPTTGSKFTIIYKKFLKKKSWIDTCHSVLRIHCCHVLRETLIAHPFAWSAGAICSDLSAATVRALVLLVIPCSCAIPSPIMVLFGLFRSCKQLVNRTDIHISRRLLLRYNPAVPYELPCQSPAENKEWRAARNRTVSESKVPQSEECIHLRDRQDEWEHPNLPSLSDPRVFNRGKPMAEIVMIVDGMTITKVPVKRTCILELTDDLHPIFRPPPYSLLARFDHRHRPTCSHHPHHIIRLLHPPKIVGN